MKPVLTDEQVLDAVRCRAAGWSSSQIAARMGTTASYIRVVTNRVRADDLEQSGECPDVVAGAYW